MEFKKYMSIERFDTNNDEIAGIELGECYIFPKIDGTNASVWWDEASQTIKTGARNRELTIENDNAGFCNHINTEGVAVKEYLKYHPTHILFGEWLVPHTIKAYRDCAWRKFYVFDVFDRRLLRYLSFKEYHHALVVHGIEYIAPLSIMHNATYDKLIQECENNFYLLPDGGSPGEGIVIKNYDFKNKYGRTVWAKIVRNEFKEKHIRAMGAPVKNFGEMIEIRIVNKYVTNMLVLKTHAKIINEVGSWNSRLIPRLLSTVYHDLITEELWTILKEFKNPTINFKTLNHMTINKTKEILPELF